MRNSNFCFCFAALLLLSQAGCAKKADVISIDTVVRDSSQYDFKVVTVKGCFRASLETREIIPCAPTSSYENWIWIDDIHSEETFENVGAITEGYKYHRRTQKEQLSPAEQEQYAQVFRLRALTPIVIRGEFQSSPDKSFGHLGSFKYRIIMYKVIKIGQ